MRAHGGEKQLSAHGPAPRRFGSHRALARSGLSLVVPFGARVVAVEKRVSKMRGFRWSPSLWLLLLGLLVGAGAPVARADARTDYLVRALRTSRMFRVRAQAAISLGAGRADPQVTRALTAALRDDHPAVRAAVCSALQRQGDPAALSSLQRMSTDRESAVRRACASAATALRRVARTHPRSASSGLTGTRSSGRSSTGPARFYVAVGEPGSNVRGMPRATILSARALLRREVERMAGVQVAPNAERPRAASRVIRQRSLTGYFLDSSIVSVEETAQGLRARVSIVVQTYPDRNIRSMLQGAAMVPNGRGAAARQQAIEGALRSALRNLPQALAASSGHAGAPARGRGRRRRRR